MTENNIETPPPPPAAGAFLPRTVIVFGFVSLLNDSASEMITPLLPMFLTATLGAGPMVIGLIEGVAEATASILKLVSGWLADKGWSRRKLVIGGYTVSNVARPFIGIATGWTGVMALRFLDRVGKGVRTAPRDAMLAASVDTSHRGRAHGFHRAMDHTGAMIGPVIAFVLLQSGMAMEEVFIASVVPGIAVVLLLVLGLTKTPPRPVRTTESAIRFSFKGLDRRIKGLLIAVSGMALATVPDAFLILWAYQHGLTIAWTTILWAAANGAKAIVAAPGGYLSDHIGRTPVVAFGWTARVILLAIFAFIPGNGLIVWVLFLAYAAAIAFTEAAERALVGDFAPDNQKATVFGLYHLLSGLLALPGAILFGAIWQFFGMNQAFMIAAIMTAFSAIAFMVMARK